MAHDAAQPENPDASIDWEAIARYLAGECSADEAQRIERYLGEHPRDAEVVSALDNALSILALRDAPQLDVDAALHRVTARRDAEVSPVVPVATRTFPTHSVLRKRPNLWRITSYLAAAAVIVIAARGLLQRSTVPRSTTSAVAARTYATAVGQRDSVRLPDGGVVILGPASRLIIAAGYGERAREVELHGEAYFDIAHDTTRPFLVRVAKATIRDVGTTFVVREDRARTRVVVTSGAVLLRAVSDIDHRAILAAGDLGTLNADGRLAIEHGVATTPYLSWMQGSVDFRDAPLSEVSTELQRWYGVVLRVDDTALARRHLRLTINGDPLDRVLRMIGLGLGANVEMHGDTAILRPVK